jgi:hypothetical protein
MRKTNLDLKKCEKLGFKPCKLIGSFGCCVYSGSNKKKCKDCKGSGVVKTGEFEYQQCPCMEKKHGGKRKGAGRKKKEPTKTIRVPLSKVAAVLATIGKA